MSGSGGGGSWRPEPKQPVSKPKVGGEVGGSRTALSPDPCAIVETTTLNSVNRTVVSTLRTGDFLDVVFQPGPPQILVAQTTAGQIAGSITSPSMLQIIQCIGTGVNYVAEVLSVVGAQCRVRIQKK